MDRDQSNSLKFKRSTRTKNPLAVSVEMEDSESNSLSSHGNEKRLKKDDSGINVDRVQDSSSSSEEEEDEEEEEEVVQPVGRLRPIRLVPARTVEGAALPKISKDPSELNSPDSGNLEGCSMNDMHDAASSEMDMPPASECGDDSAVDSELDRDRKDRDDDDDNDNSDDDSKENKENDPRDVPRRGESEDRSFYDPTPSVPFPKHKWVFPKCTMSREYGKRCNYSPYLFRYECYGSLHMVERLELMYKMKKHDGCVNALNFNASGTRLVSGSDDLNIVLWDWATCEPVLTYNSGHRSNVFQAKFLPFSGDCQIVSCARDGQVRVAELSSTGICKSTRKLAQHKGAAHKLAVHPESPCSFISCGEDAAVFEIDLREAKPIKLVICKENDKKVPLYSVHINPMKSYEYVVAGRDHFVRVYDKRCIRQEDGMLQKFSPEHFVSTDMKANVTSVVYSYSGEEILASFNDQDIYLFDAKATDPTKFLHVYQGHRNSQTVKGVNFFGPKSEYIISGSDCGYIFFWDKETEHIVNYMHGDEGGVVNCLEPNPNMPVLATSGLDDDIKIWVPSCEDPPNLSGLRDHIITNMKDREDERSNEPDAFDDQMIWFLMQHLRRARRRNTSDGADTAGSSSSSSSSDTDSHEEDDTEMPHSIQCSQS